MNFSHLQEESLAIDFLSDHLIEGTLVIFLGAGASKGFGLPNWLEFTNKFREKVGLDIIDDVGNPEKVQNALDEALDLIGNNDDKKREITKQILYVGAAELDVKLAFSNHLLISLSSLLIGSKRGH